MMDKKGNKFLLLLPKRTSNELIQQHVVDVCVLVTTRIILAHASKATIWLSKTAVINVCCSFDCLH